MTTAFADENLIRQLKAGDLEALGKLYDRHNAELYRAALGITNNRNEAGNILHECFLNLNRAVHDLDETISLKTWFFRETVKLIYDWSKHRIRWPIALEIANSSPKNSSIQSDHFELASAIAALELQQRVVVVLHYYNSLKVDQIAEILECSQGSVKSRLHYGRDNLYRRLEQSSSLTPEMKGGYTFKFEEVFFHNKEI